MGLASYQLGRLEDARAAFEAATTDEEASCDAGSLVTWMDELMRAEPRGLVALVRTADAALAAGDADAALRTLDRREVWSVLDDQLAARLATAVLAATGVNPVRRRLVVATVRERLEDDLFARAEVPLGSDAWSREQIEAPKVALTSTSAAA